MSERRRVHLPSKQVIGEFFRYLFAGGAAFLVDFSTLIACRELLFPQCDWGVYLSVLLAFVAGHVTNYILSLVFVFRDPEERRKGWTWSAFLLFAVVGGMGAGITELGMWIGYGVFRVNYILMKAIMAFVVFVWNFVGRKLIVIRR